METDDLLLFVRVAELRSLTAAGRDLRLTPAVVSSRLIRLEKKLGMRLLNRTTRQVDLTPDGHHFLQHSLNILEAVDQAQSAIALGRDSPAGALKVSAPVSFARLHLAPMAAEFTKHHPQVQLQLVASDRFDDFFHEQIDLLIRVAELKDSNMVARRLATGRRVFCASPDYLARAGTPETPEDLARHNCLLLRFPGSQQWRWTLVHPSGRHETLSLAGTMDSDNSDILTGWCLSGQGIAMKDVWEVAPHLKESRLIEVLPDYPPVSYPITALYPHSQYLPPRV
ncbi:MAG TPA: LysR family transcriptional regulator, partial [Gammaproteobacteria bacterium]|nr:LysR family transcriptional regulator [Gammaproteobacteria bacterium]